MPDPQPVTPTPQENSLWSKIKTMGWPVALLVALIGLYDQKIAEDVNKAINKPDIVAPDGSTKPAPIDMKDLSNVVTDIVNKILDKNKQEKPDAVTPPTPSPGPVKPTDGVLAIALTDEAGKAITASTVDPGLLFRVSAKNATGKVAWQPVKHGDIHLMSSTDGTEFVGYLQPGQWVDFGLTDFGSQKQVSMRISCNQGPQPPPAPDTVDPPAPHPPVEKSAVSLIVLYDRLTVTPDHAIVLNDVEFWDSFKAAGNTWRFLNNNDDTLLAQTAKKDRGDTVMPTLLIYNQTTQKLLKAMPLPSTKDEIKSVVNFFAGGN